MRFLLSRNNKKEKDFEILKRQLGIDLATPIKRDPVLAHKNDYSDTPALSEKAKAEPADMVQSRL